MEYLRLKWYYPFNIIDIAAKQIIHAGNRTMPVYCDNHPRLNALFTCPKCHANLCPSCIAVRKHEYFGQAKDVYLCSECNIFLEKLPLMSAFEPFWQRLPSILSYPLQLHCAILIVALALLQSFFTHSEPPDLVVHFVSFVLLLVYASLVMAASANGRLTRPLINRQALQKVNNLVLHQIVLFTAIGAFIYKLLPVIAEYFDFTQTPLTTFVTCVILFLILPAIIIMLFVSRSFFAALLPNIISRLAWRIGWPYPALSSFLGVLFALTFFIARTMWNTLPPAAGHFLATVFAGYYLIASYHLLGYFLFQYQEKAGYKIDFENEFHRNERSQ